MYNHSHARKEICHQLVILTDRQTNTKVYHVVRDAIVISLIWMMTAENANVWLDVAWLEVSW